MSFRRFALAAALAACLAPSARALTVDFTVFDEGSTYGSGAFAGNDANANGWLELSELSSFAFKDIYGFDDLKLADLVAFGSYTIATNTWNADAKSWPWFTMNNGYFTWDSYSRSVASNWAEVTTTPQGVSAVPEPGAWAMMGLGLLVLGARRRKA